VRPEDIILADVGDCLYSTSAMSFPPNVSYLTQSFYNSIGYSVGATLGASFSQKRRTLLFVGDGSFQIGAQEVSTMIRYGCKPIIFLLNNEGYGIERAIYDGPFNDLSSWTYHLLPEVWGGEPGILVETEEQLEEALRKAENSSKLTFIEVKVDKFDFGDILRKAGKAMAEGSKNSYD
jgi:TPP-dependent 2-oxoacid decarboxylase